MIDQIEKIIRKRWLCFYIINNIINIVFLFYFLIFKDFTSIGTFDLSEHRVIFWFSLLYNSIFVIILAWIFFYFPYVKKGTKLLTIQLVLLPFCSIWSIWNFDKAWDYHWMWILLSCIQLTLFFYFSLDLLRINRLHKLTVKKKYDEAEKITNKLNRRFGDV